MDQLDPEVVATLLQYGSYAFLFGILVVSPVELLVYGVVKALSFFRL